MNIIYINVIGLWRCCEEWIILSVIITVNYFDVLLFHNKVFLPLPSE